jgi:ribosome-binding factor A
MSRRFETGTGPSQRQLRVGELIRRTLSEVLSKGEAHDPDLARYFFTVGEVRTTPDLKLATVYVLPLGGARRAEALDALRRNRAELRRLTGRALSLKYIPDLRFEIDETYDRIDETRRVFSAPEVRRDLDQGPDEPDQA